MVEGRERERDIGAAEEGNEAHHRDVIPRECCVFENRIALPINSLWRDGSGPDASLLPIQSSSLHPPNRGEPAAPPLPSPLPQLPPPPSQFSSLPTPSQRRRAAQGW